MDAKFATTIVLFYSLPKICEAPREVDHWNTSPWSPWEGEGGGGSHYFQFFFFLLLPLPASWRQERRPSFLFQKQLITLGSEVGIIRRGRRKKEERFVSTAQQHAAPLTTNSKSPPNIRFCHCNPPGAPAKRFLLLLLLLWSERTPPPPPRILSFLWRRWRGRLKKESSVGRERERERERQIEESGTQIVLNGEWRVGGTRRKGVPLEKGSGGEGRTSRVELQVREFSWVTSHQ